MNAPSLERRIRAYNDVIRLSQNGRSPAEISYLTGIADGTIRGWLVDHRKPWTRYELFRPTSSEQLSYAIGVYMGDGSISKQGNRSVLRLHVKDREFARKFSSTCSQILGKTPYSVRHIADRDKYETTVANTSFCKFLKQTFSQLDLYIRDHPSGFLRGLADSDGCPAITTTRKRGKPWFFVQIVVATSTSVPLLSYARKILEECFGLKATLVYKGKPRPRPYEKGFFHSKKRVFDLRISRFEDIRRFSRVVGFGLSRKQVKLESAIAVRQSFGSGEEAVEEWTRNWEHGKTEWVRRRGAS